MKRPSCDICFNQTMRFRGEDMVAALASCNRGHMQETNNYGIERGRTSYVRLLGPEGTPAGLV